MIRSDVTPLKAPTSMLRLLLKTSMEKVRTVDKDAKVIALRGVLSQMETALVVLRSDLCKERPGQANRPVLVDNAAWIYKSGKAGNCSQPCTIDD